LKVGSTGQAFPFAKIHFTGERSTRSAVGTSSSLGSLRPCQTAFMSILSLFRYQNHMYRFNGVLSINRVFRSLLGLSLVMQANQLMYLQSFQTDNNLAIMATIHPVRHDVQVHMQGRAVSCPVCASKYCRRSMRHGYKDFLRRMVGWFPWHCRQCGDRFYWRKRSDD
jgi:hypothetical protein